MTNSPTTPPYVTLGSLQVDPQLADFVNTELLTNSGLTTEEFWSGFSALVDELAPINHQLLRQRDELQAKIDAWHLARQHQPHDPVAYKQFLLDIGYLVEPGEPFEIDTTNVDEEIAWTAGPQLVVPVMNARFALNACNARWGSLYDALYGTDAISESAGAHKSDDYNPVRGSRVIRYGRDFLDNTFPLNAGSYRQARFINVEQDQLVITLTNGERATLKNPDQFQGHQQKDDQLSAILLKNNGLHVDVQLDSSSQIGHTDLAGIADIQLESAITTIMDCEDSVAAVDAADKVLVYKNWLGLMKGELSESVSKNGRTFTRKMNPDRVYIGTNGEPRSIPGRSLLFVRNVGHLMMTPAVLDSNGGEIPEGLLDAVMTCLASVNDLNGSNHGYRNSRTGSIYIVKPKMHGPEEVAFSDTLFSRVEHLLKLAPNTVKLGIMDEERRTTLNLSECIRAAKSRVAFINTGFLDRTGDEIHTSMEAGPFALKSQIKAMPWIQAYETSNVAAGLACGLQGKAQIGKGMWAMPDKMAAMLDAKISQPMAGANTAWVPSPTAATLHAMHYHQVNVQAQQTALKKEARIDIDTIMDIPLLGQTPLTEQEIQDELDNNVQGILGYVVRWVDQGIGCSKVPDINNVALMEDRATLRISSQHICNWLHHGVCSEEQVLNTLRHMAGIVDQQNAADANYQPMLPNLASNLAYNAAKDLIFKGKEQPNGYTEPLLHAYRQALKAGLKD